MKKIEKSIDALITDFTENPEVFLNESDLQSDLFLRLKSEYPALERIEKTFVWGTMKPKKVKEIKTSKIHSELLLPEGRIDIAILDIKNTRLAVNSRGKFGHIQLEESGKHIFIEIKCSRTNRSSITSKKTWIGLLKKNMYKLGYYPYKSFLLCFDYNFDLTENELKEIKKCATTSTTLKYISSPNKIYFE